MPGEEKEENVSVDNNEVDDDNEELLIDEQPEDTEDLDDEEGLKKDTLKEDDPSRSEEKKNVTDPIVKAKLENRQEIIKRFGQKSEQELTDEVFRAYREIERTHQSSSEKLKALNELIENVGGEQVLKEAIDNMRRNPAAETNPQVPAEIKNLIEQGYLDPQDPKDSLILMLYQSLAGVTQKVTGLEKNITKKEIEAISQEFESGVKEKVGGKYPDVNLDLIRDAVYAGKFSGLDDNAFWAAIGTYAKNLNDGINSVVEKKLEERLASLKKLNKTSVNRSSGADTKPGKRTAEEAFDEACEKFGWKD